MLRITAASPEQTKELTELRLEMLKEVNCLPEDHSFGDDFIDECSRYFKNGNHVTLIASEDGRPVGCATMCRFDVMPTYDHPSGKRAMLMNVYVRNGHRKQGIGTTLVELMIDRAKNEGITELRTDPTVQGRRLYERCGFIGSGEAMLLDLNYRAGSQTHHQCCHN